MKGKKIFKQIIRDFHGLAFPRVVNREYAIPLDTGKIITLIGARRCGKTYLLYQLINRLTPDIDKEKIIFVNFEDERLDIQSDELDALLQAILELYPGYDNLSGHYFFFDEIQNIPGWEKFVRRLYDQHSKHIFVTGSNSKLLSSEIASALRGRSLSYTIYPLSFREYLRFKEVEPDPHATLGHARIRNALQHYLEQGGFPETALIDDSRIQRQVLQEYYQVMTFRDLIERYQISNIPALRFFLKRLAASNSKQVSVNRLYNELKSAGVTIGKTSLYEFMQAAEAIFFVGTLKKHSHKVSARELGERKAYLIDTGLYLAIHFQNLSDRGKLLEQMVYWELRRRNPENALTYQRDKTECDFIVQNQDRDKPKTEVLQVCYELQDNDTRKREIKGVVDTCKTFKLDSGTIITWAEEEQIVQNDIKIQVIPVDQFLLADMP